jgi:Fe-S-cluster containining protein
MKLKVVEENPWYADGLSFTCTECGNCCTGGPGYVWLNTVEIGRLAEFLKIAPKQVIDRYCRRFGTRYSLSESENSRGEYDCVFLKEIPAGPSKEGKIAHSKRICTIYPVRPLQCRTWPFWDGTLSSETAWNKASGRCPGINKGKRYTQAQIEALRDAKDWPDKSPGSDKPDK